MTLDARRVARLLVLSALLLLPLVLSITFVQERDATGRRVGFVIPGDEDLTVVEVMSGSPAERGGLAAGDVLVEVAGRPVASSDDYDVAAAGFRRGQPASFVVERAGERVELSIRPGVSMRWIPLAVALLLGLAYLAPGAIALLQNPRDIRARLLFAFGAAVALEMSLVMDLQLQLEWVIVRFALYYLLTGVQLGLELHLASVIPRPASWLERSPWLPGAYYVIGLSVGVLSCLAFLGDLWGVQLPMTYELVNQVVFRGGTVMWALAVPAILYVQARTAGSVTERHQALLVLLGVLPWSVFTVVWEGLHSYGLTAPGWIDPVQTVVLLAYPVAVFVAIYRYSLFDVELVVRRSLVYATLTGALILVFYAALGAGGALFSRLVPGGERSVWVISGATLLLGLLFSPLRERLQTVIDRRVFPERVALRERLTQLAAHLPARGSLPSMGRHLVHELERVFALRSATLLVADPKSRVLVTLASSAVDLHRTFEQSFLIGADDPGLRLLRRTGKPLRLETVAPHSESLAQRMHAFGAVLVVGLYSGENLVGVLLLGEKTTGDRFLAEEQELLGLFSHTVATVLENARLFESATYEGLTGLLRREAVLEVLEREMLRAQRYGRPLTVGMADIDRFKRVNDLHGHLAGDALLKRVAQALAAGLRGSDIIGRYGGEEFLFVLPETDLAGAVQVAEKLRTRVAEMDSPVPLGEPLTISIGLGTLDLDDPRATTTHVIAAADQNLMAAKREGRNRVVPGAIEAA